MMIERRQFSCWLGALATTGLPVQAGSRPRQVLLMRHAEKNGDKTDPHLNSRGYARAAALPRLFPARFDVPEFLFASAASKHSNRPAETIAPLARALRLKIDVRFDDDRYAPLARELLANSRYAGKTVLICWHHGRIPPLAAALGVANPPAPWPDAQFDRVWRIQLLDGVASLDVLPQHLLDGDV
jgi:phosphohistidine phosphatase SixA